MKAELRVGSDVAGSEDDGLFVNSRDDDADEDSGKDCELVSTLTVKSGEIKSAVEHSLPEWR